MFDLYGTEMYCHSKMQELLKEAAEQRLLATIDKSGRLTN